MKTDHITPNDLTGYIYRTLDDAHREVIDAHLLNCSTCRANLSQQELRQRQITNELSAVLTAASPARQMNFANIAPHLEKRTADKKLWAQLTAIAPAAFALTGLLLAVFGLWDAVGVAVKANGSRAAATLPALGCFLMTLASVEQFDRALRIRPRVVATWTMAIALWLGSAIIGLLDLIVLRDLAIIAVRSLDGGRAEAGPAAIIAVYIGVVLYIGFVIGAGEYHYKNIGQPGSWKLFSITLLAQLLILILPYLII